MNKKILTIIFGFCISIIPFNNKLNIKTNQNIEQYSFNNPEMSTEDYKKYCIENKIYSASAPSEDTTGRLLEGDVSQHLNNRFLEYSSWAKYSTTSVSDKYAYEQLDYKYHYEICSCGTIIIKHNFVLNRPTNIIDPNYVPKYVCIQCGYNTMIPPITE